jgi:hypothetical protein
MTDVAYWRKRGYSLSEAKHRAKFTARGTRRKTAQERAKVHKQVWRTAWAEGTRVKAPKKKLLTPAQRSEKAALGWETRRKNQKKLERKAAKLRRERTARRLSQREVDQIVQGVTAAPSV